MNETRPDEANKRPMIRLMKFGKQLLKQNSMSLYKRVKGTESFYEEFSKFTVVELLFEGKRYHGLSICSSSDKPNQQEGIAKAFHKAWIELYNDQFVQEIHSMFDFAGYINQSTLPIGFCNVSILPQNKSIEILDSQDALEKFLLDL